MFRKIMESCLIIILIVFFALSDESEAVKAMELVKKAANFINTNGSEMGKEELKKSNGMFCKGGLYVFAYDTTGVMVAHPKNHKLIGINLIDIPDIEGKFFRKEMIVIAKNRGHGWVSYKYRDPGKKGIEMKTTYVHKSAELVLCCGILK